MATPCFQLKSLNCSEISSVVSENLIPHIVFEYTITTHEFYSSSYFKPLTKKHTKLHNEIMRLHNKGWGYTKIHHHLLKNRFEIGNSRTFVNSIIKKIKKRKEFLSQPIINRFENILIGFLNFKLKSI